VASNETCMIREEGRVHRAMGALLGLLDGFSVWAG
jgi:hypothetical protein